MAFKNIISLIFAASSFFETGHAQDIPSIKKDIIKAQKHLLDQRESIASERPELIKTFQEIQNKLQGKRRKMRLARMEEYELDEILKSLKSKHYLYSQDYSFIEKLLRDYSLRVDTFLLPGEKLNYDNSPKDTNLTQDGKSVKDEFRAHLSSLETGIKRMEKLLGGAKITGQASSAEGELKEGTYFITGPVSWFVAKDGSLKGSVLREKGSGSPRVIRGDSSFTDKLILGKESFAKIDITGGRILALKSAQENGKGTLRKAGFWILPILLLALISGIIGVMKIIEFSRIKTPSPGWINELLSAVKKENTEEAMQVSQTPKHPASQLMSECLEYVESGPDVVEEVLYERLISVENKLYNWLPFIAITAAAAPLLGLLGTVSGMVRTFDVISFLGTGDAKPLAGGISEALLTTFFGLVVAIPALILHALLIRRAQGILQNTEKLGLRFINGLRKKVSST